MIYITIISVVVLICATIFGINYINKIYPDTPESTKRLQDINILTTNFLNNIEYDEKGNPRYISDKEYMSLITSIDSISALYNE